MIALLSEGEGVDTAEGTLIFGDYLVTTSTGGLKIVERKAINDLHNSVVDGRLFRELAGIKLVEEAEWLLMLEGDMWGGKSAIYGDTYARAGIHPNSLRGAVLWAQRQGVRIIPSKDIDDTVQALLYLAKSVN